MGLIGASAAILLPETKGKEIPDTVEGMIDMHSNEIEWKQLPIIKRLKIHYYLLSNLIIQIIVQSNVKILRDREKH